MATTATARGTAAGTSAQRAAVARVERAIRSAVRPPRSRYLQEFAAAFHRFQMPITEARLLERAIAADVVLIGDYHSLASCQEFAASFLRQLAARDGRANVLGLEAVYSVMQPVLDEWQRGRLDEEDLRQRLRFARDWGYDWEPYRDLFTVARRECAAVWGLDSEPRFDLRRVRVRDRHIAGRIREMRRAHAQARIVVFIGESHLAPDHLPRLLRESGVGVLTILQNVDALYWQLADGAPPLPGHVSVSEDTVCVFNASPLEKYESYQEYLERWRG